MLTCKDCKYFKVDLLTQKDMKLVNGECHRWPPHVTMLQTQDAGKFVNMTNFPLVHHTKWCGEFAARLAEAN